MENNLTPTNLNFETKILYKSNEVIRRETLSSLKKKPICLTIPGRLEPARLNSSFHRVNCHGSVCRPFSTGDRYQSTFADQDQMVARDRGGAFGVWVYNQWSDSAPGR